MTSATATEKNAVAGLSRLVTIDGPVGREFWPATRAREVCRELEAGNIVFLPRTPIEIPSEDRETLLGRKQSSSAYHKNIAYRPLEDRVTGLDKDEAEEGESCGGYYRTIRGGRWNFCAIFWGLMRRSGSWSLRVSGRLRKRGARRGYTRATICCTLILFQRGRRMAGGFCGSLRILIPRKIAFG